MLQSSCACNDTPRVSSLPVEQHALTVIAKVEPARRDELVAVLTQSKEPDCQALRGVRVRRMRPRAREQLRRRRGRAPRRAERSHRSAARRVLRILPRIHRRPLRRVRHRARLAADIVTTRMAKRMPELQIRVDLVGRASLFGALAPACSTDADVAPEVRLRFAAQHAEREPLELLLDEVEALYCSGPAGGAGVRRYLTPRLASASCLIERDKVIPSVTFVSASE